MNLNEYKKIKELQYDDYLKYLKEKYGIPKKSYFCNDTFKSKNKISRTDEGLFVHHDREDSAIMLSDSYYAKDNPFEWQLPENLTYCDYLEHFLLHILVFEKTKNNKLGVGGIETFFIPELNDFYNGLVPDKEWKRKIANKIINDKKVYEILLKRYQVDKLNYLFGLLENE